MSANLYTWMFCGIWLIYSVTEIILLMNTNGFVCLRLQDVQGVDIKSYHLTKDGVEHFSYYTRIRRSFSWLMKA
jgi:hypothetical protein